MRTIDRPDDTYRGLGTVKTPVKAPSTPAAPDLRQVSGARPGVVSDTRTGAFQTIPTSEVRK